MALQRSLLLKENSLEDATLHRAWVHSGLSLPYELAVRNPALAICLRNLADATRSKHQRKRFEFTARKRFRNGESSGNFWWSK